MALVRIENLPSLKFEYFTIVLLITIDLVSKLMAENYLAFGESIGFIPFVDLLLVFNSGIAFSMLDFNNAFTSYGLLFLGIALVAYLHSMLRIEKVLLNRHALILILAGAIGNLIDRSMDGVVTDFLYFYIGNTSFFIFNLADAFISIGAVIFFGSELKKYLGSKAL